MTTQTKLKSFILIFFSLLSTHATDVSADNRDQLSQELVNVPSHNINFRKPKLWLSPRGDTSLEVLERLDKNKENISELLDTRNGSIPISTFVKYNPDTYPGIIPTINVLIRENPHTEFVDFKEAMKLSSDINSKILNNFIMIEKDKEVILSGKKVVYSSCEFDINTYNGTLHHIKNISYDIPFDGTFIQVSMSEETPPKNSKLFMDFINSFTFR